MNPAPTTVRVKSEPPAAAPDGLRLEMDGVGLGAVMKKAAELLAAPSVLTVTVTENCEISRFAATDAVNWFALTNEVGSKTPFHWTIELALNPVPFTVRVKAAPPATDVSGLRLVIAEMGPTAGVTVKDEPALVVPFVVTVTVAVPCEAIRLATILAVS